MNVVFLGTPEFSVPVLEALIKSRHTMRAAVSQPDRALDRKGNPVFTPVKEYARTKGIRVLQYQKVSLEGIDEIKSLNPDIIVTAAFGQMLSEEFLNIAPVFNVHASLLPKFRGAAPIQAAILNGEKTTGVTVMRTVLEMDAGDILLAGTLEIGESETCGELQKRLAVLGGELIVKAIDLYEYGKLKAIPQQNEKATYTKKVVKSDGLLDFAEPAEKLVFKIRAFNPWPSGQAGYNGNVLKIFAAKCAKISGMSGIIGDKELKSMQNGTVICSDNKNGLIIKCGVDALKIELIQSPGKKILPINEFLRGYTIPVGSRFYRIGEVNE